MTKNDISSLTVRSCVRKLSTSSRSRAVAPWSARAAPSSS
eukprot:SAG22_NODE_9505_length_586_cov_0.952772_2_plen_39_part_01